MKRSFRRFSLRCFIAVTVCMVAVLSAVSVSAAMPVGYTDNRLEIVAEPNGGSKYMDYFQGGEAQDKGDMPWVTDAERGNVLSLSGKNEYLRVTSDPLPLIKSTFTAWVKWEENGDADPVLFSMASQKTDDYLVLSLHRSDEEREIDGVYLHFWHL